MSISVIGRRYAHAVFALASEQNAVDQVGQDLRDFAGTFTDNRTLQNVFENPGVSGQARRDILRDIAQSSGMHAIVRDTLLLLSDRNRLRHVDEVSAAFDANAEALSGRIRAEVTTAGDLPDSYFEELTATLKRVTGKDVVVVRKLDPSLIGGVVTRVGDQVFDGSIKHQLSELKEQLLG
ncbi:MAG: ATP synthase F1 subunit delta [Myxococcales bacterium]|nr:ATP synthase F1 subunit delta [Myxococcales bacterium]